MSARGCERCGASLEGMRPDARYCSGRCRTAASRERADDRSAELEPWLTKRQMAALLGVSERTIERRLHDGLPVFKDATTGLVRFRASACRRWMEDRGVRPDAGVELVTAWCRRCGYSIQVMRGSVVALPACPSCLQTLQRADVARRAEALA